MHDQPLVSITMPAFNAEQTIFHSIKSLQMQTYQNWECIVVDDGSTDSTANIVKDINDDRIKLISLERNMGRGYARQVALDNCSGDYIAMLDADDWYYSYKLEYQIKAFLHHPDLVLVSCGMAVTDSKGDIIGIRSIGDSRIKTYNSLEGIPVPHAPSMYKASEAKKIKYDSRFKLAQDVDFMRRLLINEKYILLDFVGYVYEEANSKTPIKDIKSYYYNSLSYLKFRRQYPTKSLVNALIEIIKIPRLLIYTSLGSYERLILSRNQIVSYRYINEFQGQKELLINKINNFESH